MITFSRLGNYGRFGNQLFQIASTIGIARKHNTPYTFPEWVYSSYFANQLPKFPINIQKTYQEEHPYYEDINLNPSLNWDLLGYFQSWKYFDTCMDEVKYYLDFDRPLLDKVAIHVRRGDYKRLSHIHPLLDMEYYTKAMKLFSGRKFTVFSDEPDWCAENFKMADIEIYSDIRVIEPFMYMASHSDFIIANSSYSYWAALLSKNKDKLVVAPKHYVTGEYKDDRLLPEWIKI